MKLHKAQKEVVRSKARFKVLNCGRGWGKTHLAIEMLLWHAVNQSDGRVAYIAPTFQQARDIAWLRLEKRTVDVQVKSNESRLELTLPNTKGNTSTIVLRGWEAVETLRGQEFDFLVIDEVASMRNFWVGWEEVLRPTLRVSQGGVTFISTPKGFNHFYDLYNTDHENWDAFHYTSYDNPHLPVGEIEEAKAQMTVDRFAQEYLADFRKQEGLVYKEFSRDIHVTDKEAPSGDRILGIDFGYTNPAAIVEIIKDYDSNYWVVSEWYKTGKTEAEIAEIAATYNANFIYADPESPSAIEEMKRKGLSVRDVVKGKDSVTHGIQKIRELFKANKIFIHPSCQNLISELEMYRYPEKRPERNEDERPIKENDHALDALRYALTMHNPVPSTHSQEYNLYASSYD